MRLLLILSLLVITVGFSAEPRKTVIVQTDDSSAYVGISSFEEDDESYDVIFDDTDDDSEANAAGGYDDDDDDYAEDTDTTYSVSPISSEAEIDIIEDAIEQREHESD